MKIKNISSKKIYEERGLFLINFIFIITIILTIHYNIAMSYFFFTLIGATFILSYISYSFNKTFSKGIILTNSFVLAYFSYPFINQFVIQTLNFQSPYLLVFYTLFLAYIFLEFLHKKEEVLQSISNISFMSSILMITLGICVSFIFLTVGEFIPSEFFKTLFTDNTFILILNILIISILIGISEQLLFTGFLYNAYSTMTKPIEAQIQTSFLFVAFHMLRIDILINQYSIQYGIFANIYLFLYLLALFLFIFVSISLYRGIDKFSKPSIAHSMLFHASVDFFLILLIVFT